MVRQTLRDTIAGLHEIFANDDVNVNEVRDLLAAYNSCEEDWKQFAFFDPHRYTRNLVDAGNTRFNAMILCWGPGMSSRYMIQCLIVCQIVSLLFAVYTIMPMRIAL